MQVQRSHLAAALAAAALFYGWSSLGASPALLAGDDPGEPQEEEHHPAWLDAAFAEMKATKRPGIAIVLPEKKEAREALRAQIENLLRNAPFDAQVHLLDAVYVLVEARHIGAEKDVTAVLLDPDGNLVADGKVEFTPGRFAQTVKPLLREGGGFAARVKAARTEAVVKALTSLEKLDPEKQPEAEQIERITQRLAGSFDTTGAAVIDAYESAKQGEYQTRLFWVVQRAFVMRRGDEATAAEKPMPFGAQWKRNVLPAQEIDPCPPCGMARVPARHRDVMEFLAKEPTAQK